MVFHQVQFGYTPDRLLMKGVDLAVEPGQKVAIVGPTGAGKTTLINLLMRFYELSGGSIQVDGVDIRQMCPGGAAGPLRHGPSGHLAV